MDIPTEDYQVERIKFDYLEEYQSWDQKNLQAWEAASNKRQREYDKNWLDKYGLDGGILEHMIHVGGLAAIDTEMTSMNETRSKRALGQEIEQERSLLLAQEKDPFKQMMMKRVWKTEDAHEDLIHVVQSTKTDIKRVGDALQSHAEGMDTTDARTDNIGKTS
ncbi:unnamed protein product [Prorocentrum cordatum]|uniref:Uncharacterized protein n=1 Tax=Prorocentrum cordatum TaxID=2364126 RepID=A0ABN9XNS1_9DINO|nr:unnamed protein product [Polarella glacialis]